MNDTTTESTSRRSRKKPSRALIATVAVVVAAGGWYGVTKYLKNGGDEEKYIYATVTTGDIEDLVTATGTLEPRDYVDVGAQVSGQIEKLFVEVGDVVKKGDVLASIDATTAKARVEANQAQMLSSQTNLKTQETNLEKARRDYQRQVNLKAADATTEEAVLNAKTTLENAERQIITSKAQIAQQEANMRIEARNLEYTDIVAPIDGTVMSIAVKEGQTVNATQNVPNVMKIANLSTMTVRSEVSEADVSKVYEGIPVYFTTLSGQNRRWTSELKRIEPTPKVQNSVVLYPALFDVENEGSLKPSMTAQVFFVAAKAENVLMVPMAALQQGQQIAREMAAKEREAKGEKTPAGRPGAPGVPGAAPNAAAAAVAPGAPGAPPNAGATPPAAVAGGPEAVPGGNRPNGQGMRGGQPGGNGQRPGGAGGFGGFNGGQPPTAEQMEQFRRMRAAGGQGGGGFGGQRPPGGFGGMNAGGAGGGAARAPQQRRGTVMVKLADGKLEPRQVVIGVTNRVHGQVLEGLKEGEEVVIGLSEPVAAPGSATQTPNANQNQNRPNQGGFPGGGFPGGGGRPF
jgi:macrolide-specific efflux system membrane fusion protein